MNKVFMIGNLVADPELKKTQSGISVCTFRIGVPRRFKDSAGERQSDFFSIVAWRALADLCGNHLRKGNKCSVSGSLQTRSYDAQDGTKRYVTEIVADEIEFLTPRGNAASNAPEAVVSETPNADGNTFSEVDDDDLPV